METPVVVQLGDEPVGAAAPRRSTASASSAVLTWEALCVTAANAKGEKRQILKRATGIVHPGELLAIMGPSGSGKSTLLDTLAGRLARSAALEGAVRVNGHPAQLSYGRAAYVTQDEVLIGTLTVRETVLYAARLRLRPEALPEGGAEGITDAVLSELGLTDAADTVIGNWYLRGVSIGQRRRVSIGCELVVQPALLFLDEPTSGLDAAAAYHVTRVIKRLCMHESGSGGAAGAPRTVACVIHQPASEVFDCFDSLALLADGATVYFGPAGSAADFFASAASLPVPHNRSAADHLLHCVNADFGEVAVVADNVQKLLAAYEASPLRAALDADVAAVNAAVLPAFESSVAPPPAWRQALVLTRRTLTNNWRDLGVFWMRLVMYVMLCFCIGFIYFRMDSSWKSVFSRTALLFFVVAFLTFMSISAFPAFVEDMKVFTRERLNGYYGVATFVIANTASSLPFIALITIASSTAVYFLANLNYHSSFDRFVYFCLDLFFSLAVVESLMMAIAPLVPHFLMGLAAGAGALGFFMLVCGFFQPRGELPKPVFLYPSHYISFQTYAFYGFMRNEFSGTHGWGCPCSSQPGGCPAELGGSACRLTGEQVLEYWDVPDWNKWAVTLPVLTGWAIFYRLVFYATCKMKENKARG